MDKIFKEIALEENAIYSNQSEKYIKALGSWGPESLFHLEIPYKNATIYLTNVVEQFAIGELYVHLPEKSSQSQFEIDTRTHFEQLFVSSKSQVKIKTKSKELKSLLKESLAFYRLQKISSKTQFDPSYYGKNIDGKFVIKTEYSLSFGRRSEVLRPLIALSKELIDLYSEN